MDLLAVDRGDEGLVQQAVDLVRDAVGGMLGIVDGLGRTFAVVFVAVSGDQLFKRLGGGDQMVCLLYTSPSPRD